MWFQHIFQYLDLGVKVTMLVLVKNNELFAILAFFNINVGSISFVHD